MAAHHLELSGRMDGLWSAMLNAVADLVSGNEAEADSRRYTHGLADAATDRHRARYFATSVLQHMPVKADCGHVV